MIIPFFNLVPISIYYPSIFLITFHSGMFINSVNANPTKWSNILKQFVGNLPTNCLSVFDHLVRSALQRVKSFFCFRKSFWYSSKKSERRAHPMKPRIQTSYRHIRKVGPGTRDPRRLQVRPRDPGPETPKCICKTRDPGPPMWDPGSRTAKYSS